MLERLEMGATIPSPLEVREGTYASEKLGAIGHNANEGCAFFLARHLFFGTVRTFCGPRFEAENGP